MFLEEKIKPWIAALLFILIIIFVGYSENHYTRLATYYGDSKFIDKQGYVWMYDGDFEIGNTYTLSMFTSGTDSIISDDKVLDVK